MLRKLGISGLVAAAALGSALVASPAQADGFNQNTSLIPINACQNDIAAVIGVIVPIASPETLGECNNASAVQVNVDDHHHGHHHHGDHQHGENGDY
ncbi:hypothetical protein [Allonocardiopsis opalescens]|uniref:Small secreted domain DUF320 n=1 Tax=Allonocardiopsis opalescens TaxID=1144618 RepID=A0A2T0Q811_9ACTN|nr:hypothetical protein [Allonocardiopsis opalescens]PRX99946.1 hypothetical protein CLV72_103554 [Allonocardiopsis opalescens]